MFLKYKFQNLDGRWIILAALIIYFSILLLAESLSCSYEKMWNFLGVQSFRSFLDLKILLCGLDEYNQNRDPYTWIKCTYNYPLLWVVFSYIPYFSSPYLNQIGIALIFLFFLSILAFIKRVSISDSLIYCILLLSPSIMLAVERGNCDIIIFLLIVCSLFFLSKGLKSISYIFLLLSAFLKLYPIVGFIYLLEHSKTKKTVFLIGFGVVLLFVFYLLAIQGQLKPIYKIHPRSFFLSYGIYTFPARIYAKSTYFPLEVLKMGALIVTILGCSYFIIVSMISTTRKKKNLYEAEPTFFNSYLIGSSIFVSTFIAGNNFDYRLIFLIFTFPQLLYWFRLPHLRNKSLIQLFILGFILWSPFILAQSDYLFSNSFIVNLLDEVLSWILFFIHVKFLTLYICQKLMRDSITQ